MTKKIIVEKEKRTNIGNDKHEGADSLLQIQIVIPNVCTKFQNSKCSSSCQIFDTNFS